MILKEIRWSFTHTRWSKSPGICEEGWYEYTWSRSSTKAQPAFFCKLLTWVMKRCSGSLAPRLTLLPLPYNSGLHLEIHSTTFTDATQRRERDGNIFKKHCTKGHWLFQQHCALTAIPTSELLQLYLMRHFNKNRRQKSCSGPTSEVVQQLCPLCFSLCLL